MESRPVSDGHWQNPFMRLEATVNLGGLRMVLVARTLPVPQTNDDQCRKQGGPKNHDQ